MNFPSMLVLIVATLFTSFTTAQNDLVVFSDGGEKFYLYVNGVKQNATTESNVRVTNIKQSQVRLKVVFEDNKKNPDITTNAFLMWEGEEKKGWEFVYRIINKAGSYKIRAYSAAEINPQKNEEQTVVNYSSEQPPVNVSGSNSSSSANANTYAGGQTVTSTTVVASGGAQTSNSNASNPANINITLSPTGTGIQIHDNMNTSGNNGYTTTVVSTTVTSSSSESSSNAPKPVPQSVSPKPVIRCNVSDAEFQDIKKSVSSKSFEESKLTLAKQISDSKCLSSVQVRDIMKLFSFEQTKLEFAKYAYKKIIDKDNYYVVNDAFQFENSIEELNESIGK